VPNCLHAALALIALAALIVTSACQMDTGEPREENGASGPARDASGMQDARALPDIATDVVANGSDAQPQVGGKSGDARSAAYVLSGPGPFGIMARPSNQTCKAPASYTQPVATLSATGCVDPKDPTQPAPSLIPYTVASPLWSDGAGKQRFMAIPDGALINVKDCTREPDTCKSKAEGGTPEDEGHFEFPIGTVLVKNFLFQRKPFETRLFVKFRDDFWVGYSYMWNTEKTEANLVAEDGLTKLVANDAGKMQSWYFPSRSDCLLCHNSAVGFALGPETRMLNIPFDYPSGTTANQIETFEHIGLFDAPVKRLPPLPTPASGINAAMDDPATLDARARSYLHANCAICHRPEGNFQGMDMRFWVLLKEMNICNVDPLKGTAPVTLASQAKRLVPGHPELSVLYARIVTLDPGRRMPQIATGVLDPIGTLVVSDWIKSISQCP
jgi:hypothetical protein